MRALSVSRGGGVSGVSGIGRGLACDLSIRGDGEGGTSPRSWSTGIALRACGALIHEMSFYTAVPASSLLVPTLLLGLEKFSVISEMLGVGIGGGNGLGGFGSRGASRRRGLLLGGGVGGRGVVGWARNIAGLVIFVFPVVLIDDNGQGAKSFQLPRAGESSGRP